MIIIRNTKLFSRFAFNFCVQPVRATRISRMLKIDRDAVFNYAFVCPSPKNALRATVRAITVVRVCMRVSVR